MRCRPGVGMGPRGIYGEMATGHWWLLHSLDNPVDDIPANMALAKRIEGLEPHQNGNWNTTVLSAK